MKIPEGSFSLIRIGYIVHTILSFTCTMFCWGAVGGYLGGLNLDGASK